MEDRVSTISTIQKAAPTGVARSILWPCVVFELESGDDAGSFKKGFTLLATRAHASLGRSASLGIICSYSIQSGEVLLVASEDMLILHNESAADAVCRRAGINAIAYDSWVQKWPWIRQWLYGKGRWHERDVPTDHKGAFVPNDSMLRFRAAALVSGSDGLTTIVRANG
jgi:hypothetical protein